MVFVGGTGGASEQIQKEIWCAKISGFAGQVYQIEQGALF